MKLNLETVKSITAGAVQIEEREGRLVLNRFTKKEEELYKSTNERFLLRSYTPSGIKLNFSTNSEKLSLKVNVSPGSSRTYFAFDLFINGEYSDSLSNYTDSDFIKEYALRDYTTVDLPLGNFEKTFDLGKGKKAVTLYFPWSVKCEVEEISLDDDSFIEPIKSDKKILMYGDSITHGYDALHPSNKYATRLANALKADEYNKAIGGEIFFPPLAKIKQSFTPDLITVAYGTNDWSYIDKPTFDKSCKAFYESLAANYPDTPIFAITPIWRKEILTETKPFGDFSLVEEGICEATKGLKNVKVINGFDFVPKEEKYFADLRLHPNDEGFKYYAESLHGEIKYE